MEHVFMGSIPGPMRQYVTECVRGWGVEDLWVGCSGNFTIERCLPDIRHHGNDVTLYSSTIGWWAARDDTLNEIRLNEAGLESLGWLQDYMGTPEGVVSVVMLGTRFFNAVGRDNRYYRRTVDAYRSQWDTVFGKTLDSVKKSALRLEDYYCGDVNEWLADRVPADAAVAMFPPFFGGDYESMFAPLEKFLAWPAPTYPELDEPQKDQMVARIVDRESWMIGLHHPRPELHQFLMGRVQTTNRGVPVYIYASPNSPRRVVAPRQPLEQVMVSRLGVEDELDGSERVALCPLTAGQFSTLRSQYMNHTIRPGQPLVALAVTVNGKIAGCLAFATPDSKIDPHTAYMLSDFPVTPSRYRRLAALVVRCAQSTEAKRLLERSLSRRITYVDTTAFSDNPTSMKYRSGGMRRVSKKAGTDGHHKYMLQYSAEAGRWSLQDALGDWVEKHGKHQVEI